MMKRQFLFLVILVLYSALVTNSAFGDVNQSFIEEWLVLGVFPYEQGQERLTVDFLDGEHNVVPYDGAVTAGKAWKTMHVDYKGKLDFITQGGFGDTEYSVCYAHTFIKSPIEGNGYLLVGSDDAVRIYVNGIDVHYHEIPRGWRPDQDTVFVRLGAGWNRIMAKVANGVGDFALSARLVDEHGQPLAEIQSQSENPAGEDSFESVSVSPWLRIRNLEFSGFSMQDRDLWLELDVGVQNLGTEIPPKATVRLQGAFGDDKEYEVGHSPSERVVFQFTPEEIERLARGDKQMDVRLSWDKNIVTQQLLFEPWDVLELLFVGVELQGWKVREEHVDVTMIARLDPKEWTPYIPSEGIEVDAGTFTFTNNFFIPPMLAGFSLDFLIPEEYNIPGFWINGEEKQVTKGRLSITESATEGQNFSVLIWADSLDQEHPFAAVVVPKSERFSSLSADAYWAPIFTDGQIALGDETKAQLLVASLQEDKSEFHQLVESEGRRICNVSSFIKEEIIHVIGNAHIDMAWLWPWTETVDVCRVTFERALENMEKYPDFVYAQSQAQAYVWMEERYPELFEEIRRRVDEGRWIIVGGTWVEPDNNLPSGESQVRQILYGKRYFKEKFGVDVNIGWIPDSFGYAWTLPQIYRKSGFKYFITQKLTWNDTNEFPHKVFYWQSPDSSRLYCYFPYTYVHNLEPTRLANQFVDYRDRTGLQDQLVLYGEGDHGGGPSEEMIERVSQLQPICTYPTVRHESPQVFLDNLEKKTPDLPVWNDELYLEYHRGCYTTQALIKKRNRRCEALLETAEKFASFSQMVYPSEELEAAWKKTLFNQFHDILPGSCINEVAVDAHKDYDWVEETVHQVIDRSLKDISGRIDTRGDGTPIVVFNPLSWSRDDVIQVVFPKPVKEVISVFDHEGERVASQMNGDTLVFVATDVPSIGYKTYWVRLEGIKAEQTTLKIDDDVIENTYYRLEVDPETGNWSRLYDKRQDREVIEPGREGNVLQAFEDVPEAWDAWNIGYTGKTWNIEDVESIEVIERGPVRALLRVIRTSGNSRFVQDILMYSALPRIDVLNRVDWHEEHVLLKAAFPVNVSSGFATYEIPYGIIMRSTIPLTPQDSAKFEVSAHKWIDLSDGIYGVSLLNDGKYGHDVKGNLMRMTLLRAPKWPDPEADMGRHTFTYSLYPHSGDWQNAFTYRRGYELNYPLSAVIESPHVGELPEKHSFATIHPEGVILSVIKEAEDRENLVLRFYELFGKETRAEIGLSMKVRSAFETDLLENMQSELETKGDKIYVPTKSYEIKTITVKYE